MPRLTNVDIKVGQALYQLQKETKFRRAKIKRYVDKKTGRKGYTIDYKDL